MCGALCGGKWAPGCSCCCPDDVDKHAPLDLHEAWRAAQIHHKTRASCSARLPREKEFASHFRSVERVAACQSPSTISILLSALIAFPTYPSSIPWSIARHLFGCLFSRPLVTHARAVGRHRGSERLSAFRLFDFLTPLLLIVLTSPPSCLCARPTGCLSRSKTSYVMETSDIHVCSTVPCHVSE